MLSENYGFIKNWVVCVYLSRLNHNALLHTCCMIINPIYLFIVYCILCHLQDLIHCKFQFTKFFKCIFWMISSVYIPVFFSSWNSTQQTITCSKFQERQSLKLLTTETKCEICSKLTIKTPERHEYTVFWCRNC